MKKFVCLLGIHNRYDETETVRVGSFFIHTQSVGCLDCGWRKYKGQSINEDLGR